MDYEFELSIKEKGIAGNIDSHIESCKKWCFEDTFDQLGCLELWAVSQVSGVLENKRVY
jgi:hypothetical protein